MKYLKNTLTPQGKHLAFWKMFRQKRSIFHRMSFHLLPKRPVCRWPNYIAWPLSIPFFNLQPVGTNIISVCTGTACHVKGASYVFEALQDLLGLEGEGMTENRKFILTTQDKCCTLTQARCFGACSMAPVISINEKIYGYVNVRKLPEILREYGWQEKK